jgi:alpha-glucosidase (family GH31 glycosyl hydrolase)
METIPDRFKIKLDPLPNQEAVIETEHARFTVLTPRMIRMEWSPNETFEDRASQAFWFRTQPTPRFSVKRQEAGVVIETEFLRLFYQPDAPFSAENLHVELKEMASTWYYGDPDPGNLLGTARTVDEVDGATPLSLGLISRSGWSVVDDSYSLVFNEAGWLEPRAAPGGQLDLYFLGYGHDYLSCLREFNLISGSVPMIPRFILGNWWSRYWEYSESELKQLMNDFQSYEVPLSVCIIDMDWHVTQTGNDCSGWTGYSWNRKLFPDPDGMLRFLHDKGLKAALNLHPAEGVHRHEEMYAEMCTAVGSDAQLGEPVEFDITNPSFVEAYFRILHHPQEKRGVDFWWMDWQQGKRTRLSGLDPLWWLNHLHFLDLGRDGKRRSFIFSRWGGLGNHRYPIGFSGDSVVSWASLAFQPYFTATSSNVNYGWWSHDIGGHMSGYEDGELYARWVQLGTFLPVLRLHSTKNPFHERTPWGYDAETFVAARTALQLRHAMIPYLYSMAWRFHHDSIPPLLPMYYAHPKKDEAYACPNQYLFGNQLVVAPFITPKDPETRLSRAATWLPEGDWYDYFNGQYYPGDQWHAVYGTLRDVPVFARAGAIVPQGPLAGWGNIDTPDQLLVQVFPGADGQFELYEDEGNSNAYLDGAYAVTPMTQEWKKQGKGEEVERTVVRVGPAQEAVELLPATRRLDLLFRGFNQPAAFEVRLNGTPLQMEGQYHPATHTFALDGIRLSPTDTLVVTLSATSDGLANHADARQATCLRLLKHFRMETNAKGVIYSNLPDIIANPAKLARFLPQLTQSQQRALLEVITGAGIDYTESTGDPLLVVWNNHADEHITQLFAMARMNHWWLYPDRNPWASDVAPRFIAYRPKVDFGEKNPWVIQLNYYGESIIKIEER